MYVILASPLAVFPCMRTRSKEQKRQQANKYVSHFDNPLIDFLALSFVANRYRAFVASKRQIDVVKDFAVVAFNLYRKTSSATGTRLVHTCTEMIALPPIGLDNVYIERGICLPAHGDEKQQ